MGILRLRDGKIYYVFLGCAVTCFFFLILNYSTTVTVMPEQQFESVTRNYQYEEVCSEWKKALEKSQAKSNEPKTQSSTALEELKTKRLFEYKETNEINSLFPCDESPRYKYLSQRGAYYVIFNFVQSKRDFGCIESVTLTAPGDYRFLDNVIPLIDRWRGPISIALYAPGHDFYTTMRSIAYLRQCQDKMIKEMVTFHVFFDEKHVPNIENGTPLIHSYEDIYNCSLPPPWETEKEEDMYKTKNNLLYPINVARNVAKLAAKTYFVFPSDIELYPSKNFIPLFLKFVALNLDLFNPESRNVFVLPIFEVLENESVPENKTVLLQMLKKNTAIVFHKAVCIVCHRVIDGEKWIKAEETEGLGVFSTGKREGRYMVWEPFFVCTQKEPLWDERFTWEGQGNKLIQAHTMCVLNYDFNVLDNAFLIHKPGVKKKKVQMQKYGNLVTESNKLMKVVSKEIQEIYGYRDTCVTTYRPQLLKKTEVAKKIPVGTTKGG